MLPSGASRDYPKLKAGFSIPSAPPMGNTNLLSTRTWERCGRLSKDVAQRFLVLEAEVRSPNTSSFHALLNPPFVAAGQQWQRTEAKNRELTFSSQTFCSPLGPGQSLGVEMCCVFHCGCRGKRGERELPSAGSHNPKDGRPWKELWLCSPAGSGRCRWVESGRD